MICLTTGWPCIIVHGAQLDSGLWKSSDHCMSLIFTKAFFLKLCTFIGCWIKIASPLSLLGSPGKNHTRTKTTQGSLNKVKIISTIYAEEMCTIPQEIWRNGWMKKILSTNTNTWTQKDVLRIYYIYISSKLCHLC